jgi:WhiB family redox-sensing transcriptional regulator
MAAFLGIDAGKLRWQDYAACKDTDGDSFFPEKGGATRPAKRVCNGCGVRLLCLGYAVRSEERFGVWGGMSERERRRLAKDDAQYLEAIGDDFELEDPASGGVAA